MSKENRLKGVGKTTNRRYPIDNNAVSNIIKLRRSRLEMDEKLSAIATNIISQINNNSQQSLDQGTSGSNAAAQVDAPVSDNIDLQFESEANSIQIDDADDSVIFIDTFENNRKRKPIIQSERGTRKSKRVASKPAVVVDLTAETPERQKKVMEETSPVVGAKYCPICLENLYNKELSATQCGHVFCKECIRSAINNSRCCPACRTKLTLKKIFPLYL